MSGRRACLKRAMRAALAGMALSVASSSALAFPELSGEQDRAECVQALTLARSMFEAPSARVYAPLQTPEGFASRVVLAAQSLDISGGNALTASDEFERIPLEGRSLYWARQADDGKRLAVLETAQGWRGDTYSSYLLDAPTEPDDFAQQSDATPLVADSWRPPIVLRTSEAGPNWLIDVGQPFEVLAAWQVHVPPEAGAVCEVRFHEAGVSPTESLPEAVRKVLPILDAAIGSGEGEGTLQQTARLRLNVRHLLANVALRPWAVSAKDAYNSRERVDAGLQAWARTDAEHATLHRRLIEGEGAARMALAQHYTESFGLAADAAEEVGAWMFDVLLRAHFVFPRAGEAHKGSSNPWPSAHRMPSAAAS